jgi:hypothetical protein
MLIDKNVFFNTQLNIEEHLVSSGKNHFVNLKNKTS